MPLRLHIALLCLSCLAFQQGMAQTTFAGTGVSDDLLLLQKVLYEAHPAVFQWTPKDSLDVFFDKLRGQATAEETVTYNRAHLLFAQAIAAIGDGHLFLQTPFFKDTTKVLPFTLQAIGDEVFILKNYTGDSILRPGCALLAINGHPAAEHLRFSRTLRSGDGYNQTFRQVVASVYFSRFFNLRFGQQDSCLLSLRTPRGLPIERMIATKSIADLRKLQKPNRAAPKPLFSNKDAIFYLDTLHQDVAVLDLSGFSDRKYKRFYRKTFRYLHQNHTPNLVIDLRFNTGGNVFNMGRLLSFVLDERFSYTYERRKNRAWRYFGRKGKLSYGFAALKYDILPGFRHYRKDGLKIRERRTRAHKRHNFDGKVWVLTNGWSFSAASQCASFLKNRANATVIGEESGGGAVGNCGGSFPTLQLPETGFKVSIPLFHLTYGVGKPDVGRGVMPDIAVQYTIEDVIKRRDLAMTKVYELKD